MKKRLFCLILAVVSLLSACGKEAPPEEEAAASPAEISEPSLPPEPVFTEIKIIAAGDNLLHNTVSKDCKTDDGFDYRHLYTHIKDEVQSADIAFINQEVMLTGEVNGYPNMSAPAEVADALIDTGFNVINLATNHSLDRGEEGLDKSVENTNARPFDAVLGAFGSKEASEKLIIVEKKGIKFGFLSYTYDLNGYRLKKGNEWKVALIDRQKITEDMKRIRPECDYLIVSMHWGNEYQHTPTSSEKEYAQLLCDLGADLIIGTHPHVLQPLETLASTDGTHTTVCMYSLGNFISHQQKMATMLGGMLDVKLVFDEDKKVVSVDAGVIPTVTHYNTSSRDFAIYKVADYTPELAEKHGIKKYEKPMTLEYLNGLADKVLGDEVIR